MKNNLMEEGDVIIHFIDKEKKYQWLYCRKNNTPIISQPFFDTKEEAIANVNKYAEEHHLKKPNIFG